MINPHFPGWSWRYYLHHPWLVVYDLWRDLVAFCQRGWRGYADRDCWSLDFYVSQWMPKALRVLYKNKLGYPSELDKYLDGRAVWDLYLLQMADGFEANRKLSEMEFETPEEAEHLHQAQKDGLRLFAEWYGSLWD